MKTKTINVEILFDKNNEQDIRSIWDEEQILNSDNSESIQVLWVNQYSEDGFVGGSSDQLIELCLNTLGNVGIGLLTNFLYDKLKGKAKKLWINSRETEVSKKAIEHELNSFEK